MPVEQGGGTTDPGVITEEERRRQAAWQQQQASAGVPPNQRTGPGAGALNPSLGRPVRAPGRPINQESPQNNPYATTREQILIRDPSAYYLGGEKGYVGNEAARYAGYASDARAQQAAAYGQYGQSIGLSDEARQQQLQGLGYLRGMAEGTGPSAAHAQMLQGLQAARQQQASVAASARGGGGNIAAAQQAGANAAGQLASTTLGQTAALRAQEQLGAIGQYGQQAGALRQSDYQRAQLAAAQQQAAAGQAGQYEQFKQGLMSQQAGYAQAAEQQALSREAAARGWTLSQQAQDKSETNQWIQAGTAAASIAGMIALGALSDERSKENVTDGAKDVDDALTKLKPMSFDYKPEFGGERRTGIMAQALAASKAGAGAVMQRPDGLLMVKAPEAATLALAATARLHDRLNKLEGRRGGK